MTEETDLHIDQVEVEETPKRVLKITKSPARGARPLHPHEPKMAVRINERDDEQSLFPKDKYIVTVDLPDPNQPPYIHIYSREERWSISVYIDSPKLYKVYLYGERSEGDTFEDVITRVHEWLPKPTQSLHKFSHLYILQRPQIVRAQTTILHFMKSVIGNLGASHKSHKYSLREQEISSNKCKNDICDKSCQSVFILLRYINKE